jgi:hypothetical protein
MNKRFLVKVRNVKTAAKKKFRFFPAEDPTADTFTKKYPRTRVEDLSVKHQTQLTPKEKLYFMEKELHRLRSEVGENRDRGRLTREQIFRLCMIKKEVNSVNSGAIY